MSDPVHRLTPAGLQVELALEMGYDAAAFNLYFKNNQENVAMVEGDQDGQVSVWPEWHQMIQARIGEPKTAADVLVEQHGIEGAAKVLGLYYDPTDPAATLAEIEDELEGCVSQLEVWSVTRDEQGRVLP